jgi:hypothetical protein
MIDRFEKDLLWSAVETRLHFFVSPQAGKRLTLIENSQK